MVAQRKRTVLTIVLIIFLSLLALCTFGESAVTRLREGGNEATVSPSPAMDDQTGQERTSTEEEEPAVQADGSSSTATPVTATEETVGKQTSDAPVKLVDLRYPPVGPETEGWDYRYTATADLNHDGAEERIVVMAAVERSPELNHDHHDDAFIWDDGQPWQVYIEAPNGDLTYVFSQFVQLGTLEVMVTGSAPEDRGVLILLKSGNALVLYEVSYEAPQQFQTVELAEVEIYGYTTSAHRDN